MSETISKASVCEILADIYPTDGEKVVAVKEIDKAYEAIQQLPPAQIEEDCLKCIFRGSPGFKQFQTAQPENEQPTIKEREREWTPVSKGVPNENKYYLTTTVNGEVYCDRWIEDNFDRTELVIAWMPLPEPYKEVER